jgi:hypothetical protein
MNNLQNLKEIIKQSGFFDEYFYISIYRDVYRSGMDPIEHYLIYGWKEGRYPSLRFNTKLYLYVYKDVDAAGMNPLLHYILYGKKEGRNTFSEDIQCKELLAYAKISPPTYNEPSFPVTSLDLEDNDKVRFIIYAPPFDENSGGNVVLHRLCDLLNKLGESAYIWPSGMPPVRGDNLTYEVYTTPLAKISYLSEKTIVVYPEIIDGNPLMAKNVVRWLLYFPGFFTGKVNYGKDELFFFINKEFVNPKFNVPEDNRLYIGLSFLDIYRQTNFDKRKGTCYILRKGKDRKIVHNINNSILIDGLTHKDVAEIFNMTKYCISYDPYTAYLAYAAICGCKPIVVPLEDLPRNKWCTNEQLGYGIAYGFCDLDYAEKTRNKLLSYVKVEEKRTEDSVKKFIQKCKVFYNIK